jgi:hypothetical protein
VNFSFGTVICVFVIEREAIREGGVGHRSTDGPFSGEERKICENIFL